MQLSYSDYLVKLTPILKTNKQTKQKHPTNQPTKTKPNKTKLTKQKNHMNVDLVTKDN